MKNLKEHEGTWAAAGFSLVLLLVGLPVWWCTTTVYRASLPYSNINELALTMAYHTAHINFIIKNYLDIDNGLYNLESKDQQIKFSSTVRNFSDDEKEILKSSQNLQILSQKWTLKKKLYSGSLDIILLQSDNNFVQSNEFYCTFKRILVVNEDIDKKLLVKLIDAITHQQYENGIFEDSSKLHSKKNDQSMRQMPSEAGYDLILTLMLPQPHLVKAQWNIEQSIEDYLSPFLLQLNSVGIELNVRSQVLYMTSLKIYPKWSEKHEHFALPEKQLPLTINDIEAKLGSFVSTRPAIHFLVYIPADGQIPLHIHDMHDNPIRSQSFFVPRWGGVIIENVPNELFVNSSEFPIVYDVDSKRVMASVISQLYNLFPIPKLPNVEGLKNIGAKHGHILTDWQLDGLARSRVLSYLNNIKITLRSLCDLVGEISNMVVSDEVASWVWGATIDWRLCLDASRDSRLTEAVKHCESSFIASDKAFFHPSMLALLYFPDNQKYAIYVPLFLPVCIPVLISLKTIFKLFRNNGKQKPD